jgi:catechol 2,3-dioxygenase-like lactoylglutathione lyase family enzyme
MNLLVGLAQTAIFVIAVTNKHTFSGVPIPSRVPFLMSASKGSTPFVVCGSATIIPHNQEAAMSTKAVRTNDATSDASVARVDMKFEIVVIPVSDVDRAKEFYARLGWRLDADYDNGTDFRVIQFTPPGSGARSIGKNVTPAAPGSAQGLHLIVSDIETARNELLGRGVEVSEVFHGGNNVYAGPDEPYLFGRIRVSGPGSRASQLLRASLLRPGGAVHCAPRLAPSAPYRSCALPVSEALALHKKKEAICLELGNRSGLGYCYWQWALTAGKQGERK